MKKTKILFGVLSCFAFLPFGAGAATVSGYEYERIEFEALKDNSTYPAAVPVYEVYDATYGDHFYTTSETEKNTAKSAYGYTNEKIAFYAFSQLQEGLELAPIYRLYNSALTDHFYTASETEKDTAVASHGYVYESVAFYAFSAHNENSFPVYRLYSEEKKDHFYTISETEKNELITPKTETEEDLGPEISVGLWGDSLKGVKNNPFRVKANKDYVIKDSSGRPLAQVSASSETRVRGNSTKKKEKKLKVYGSIKSRKVTREVYFEAADGDNETLIMDVSRPDSSYDRYRGKIKIRLADKNNVWISNILPMEQYVWGMGESTGTGPEEHTKVMATMFRTYGYWYLQNATKYLPYGFRIRSDSGSQIYRGYDWEVKYPKIKEMAEETRAKMVFYDKEVALTPYSSWTDGRTRSFKERWGSSEYPWCKSVSDPYGKHPSMSAKELEAAGNHMVGLSAHGSLDLADDHDWKYDKILKYYYDDVDIETVY